MFDKLEKTIKGADKGLALRTLAEELGVAGPRIMAIGDNGNDLGMLAECGIPVAMGNATEPVKQLAALVTDSNDDDGAAKAIERMILQTETEIAGNGTAPLRG